MPWSPPPDPAVVQQRRRLEQALDREIPNWREFDRDPRWHAWLYTTHLYSTLTRQQHLNAAAASGNAYSVVELYREFLRTHSHRTPPPAGPAPDGKHIYSRPEILQLHAQHRKGAFGDVEWMRIENDIIAAGREGRIVGGVPLDRSGSGSGRR